MTSKNACQMTFFVFYTKYECVSKWVCVTAYSTTYFTVYINVSCKPKKPSYAVGAQQLEILKLTVYLSYKRPHCRN